MEKEKTDVEAAIAKLRSGIAQISNEGRSRLQAAFDTVNGHFQALFATLFGGGEARLEMIEAEDPLEEAWRSSPSRRARSRQRCRFCRAASNR